MKQVFLVGLFFVVLLGALSLGEEEEKHAATERTEKTDSGPKATTTGRTATTPNKEGPPESRATSSWKSWYHKATHLLDSMPSTSILDPKPKQKAEEITQKIRLLSVQLLKEEEKLAELIILRDALKVGWFWFLDPQIRAAVDEATVKVDNQRRVVEALYEEIALHWKQLKPLYGVFSKMFLTELTAFLIAPIISFLEIFTSAFSLGLLLFLLLFGPPAFFIITFAYSIGVALLPILGGALIITWLIEFPWLVLQYNPSFPVFIVTFAPFVLATVALALHMSRILRRAEAPLVEIEKKTVKARRAVAKSD